MITKGPFCQIIDDAPYTTLIDPSILRSTLKFEPQDGDIIQVSYPKSGTHWVQQIIQLILGRGESASNFVEFTRRAPILEQQGEEALEGMTAPRLIKTHLSLGQIPYRMNAKYVYVARNPWDSCASAYHFVKELPVYGYEGDFDTFLDLFLKGYGGFGDVFNHIISGYQRRQEANVFFLTYEELKADTRKTILKLAYFLGEEHGRTLEESEELMGVILRKSSVSYMKNIYFASQEVFCDLFLRNPEIKRATSSGSNQNEGVAIHFVREGKVGSWKKLFAREHLKKMETRVAEVAQTSDVMNLWKEDWSNARTVLVVA